MRFTLPFTGRSAYNQYTFGDEADLIAPRRWAMLSRLGLWTIAVGLAAVPSLIGSGPGYLSFAFALCAICILDALEVVLATKEGDWRRGVILFIFALVFVEALMITHWSGNPLQTLPILGWSLTGSQVAVGLVILTLGEALTARLIHAVR